MWLLHESIKDKLLEQFASTSQNLDMKMQEVYY